MTKLRLQNVTIMNHSEHNFSKVGSSPQIKIVLCLQSQKEGFFFWCCSADRSSYWFLGCLRRFGPNRPIALQVHYARSLSWIFVFSQRSLVNSVQKRITKKIQLNSAELFRPKFHPKFKCFCEPEFSVFFSPNLRLRSNQGKTKMGLKGTKK